MVSSRRTRQLSSRNAIILLVTLSLLFGTSLPLVFAQTTSHFSASTKRFDFIGLNLPSSLVVGQNFTLTGTLSNRGPPIDQVYLSVDTTPNVWVQGERLKDMGVFDSQKTKPFSFDLKVMEGQLVEITLTAYAVQQDRKEIARDSVRITVNAFQPAGSLDFTAVHVVPDPVLSRISLTALLSNTGNFPALDVIVFLRAPSTIKFLDEMIKNVSVIQPGDSVSMTWLLESLAPSSEDMQLVATSRTSNSTSLNIPLPSFLPYVANLRFTDVKIPTDLTVLQKFVIRPTISNVGFTPAKDVLMSISVPGDVIISGNATTAIGELLPYSSVTSEFWLEGKESGSFEAIIRAYSSNGFEATMPVTLSITDPNVRLAVSEVKSNPSAIFPGDSDVQLMVGVQNYGDTTLDSVTLYLKLPDGFYPAWTGSDMSTIQVLPPIEQDVGSARYGTFYFNVDPESKPGTHLFDVNIASGNYELSLEVPVVLFAKAKFEIAKVSFTEMTSLGSNAVTELGPGRNYVVRVVLKNAGTSPAESLVASMLSSNDLQGVKSDVSGTVGSTDALGTVSPRQIVEASFYISVDGSVLPGTYPSTISLSWKQPFSTDQDFTQSLHLPVSISSRSITNELPLVEISLALIGGGFFALYLKTRKGNNSKNSNNGST